MDSLNQGALTYNRQGRLAPAQMVRLLPLTLVGVLLFLIGAGLAAGLVYGLIPQTFQGNVAVGVIMGGIFALLPIWFGYKVGGKPLLDLLFGRVVHVEGGSSKDSTFVGSALVYWFYVGKESFQVYQGTYNKLPGRGSVRAYYTPRSKTLVNVEPL